MRSDVARRPLSRSKRVLFSVATALLVIGFAELVAGIAISNTGGMSLSELWQQQAAIAAASRETSEKSECIHPYFGWCTNPDFSSPAELFGRTIPVNEFGLIDDQPTDHKRSVNRIIVGITGGSVAWDLSVAGEHVLQQVIARDPQFQNHKLEIVRLAQAGYKQPQQLIELTYFLALGAEFDVIVNLDGFNELALPATENVPSRVHFSYPRSWHARTQDIVDPRDYSLSLDLLQVRARRQWIAQVMQTSWLRRSRLANLVWLTADRWCSSRKTALINRLFLRKSEKLGFSHTGPENRFESREAMYAELAGYWGRCSQQMHALCKANGIHYLHLLQPNLHVEGTKPLSAEETRFVQLRHMYGAAAAEGYPLLISEGSRLKASGLHWFDLTQLFAEVPDTVYRDQFCHFNEVGQNVLATAVAHEILATLRAEQSRTD